MTDPTNSPEALGSQYLLDSPIGAGAMGQVWRGRSREGEPVAVKVLRPELSSDPAVVARFVQEAQILTRLADPHLVRVRDLVAEGARLGIVMDLVDGPDLRTELARRGTFRPIEAAEIIDGVLAGLAAVHAGGVVHRDVKPENVLLGGGRPGDARLTDFGVARIAEESQKARRTTVIGTPEYLSPEVADGAEPTAASDLYAVGIMFYELVAGVTPFSGGSPLAVLRRHAEQAPVRPEGMPEGVWAGVTSLLAKDPAQRPPSAEAFRAWLSSAAPSFADVPPLRPLEAPPAATVTSQPTVMGVRSETQPVLVPDPGGPTRSPETGRRKRWPVVLAAVLSLAVAIGVLSIVLLKPFGGDDDDSNDAGGSGATTSERSEPAASTSRSTTSQSTTAESDSGTVPAVVGLPLRSAQTQLSNAGYRVTVTEVLDDTATDNSVTAQDPVEGTELEAGDTVTLTVARRAVAVYLARLEPVTTSLYSSSSGAVQMNGEPYVQALAGSTRCDGVAVVEYDLGRNYRQLRTIVGVADDAYSGSLVQFDVIVDGRNVFSQNARLGAPVPVDVDVTEALRLELRATRLDTDCSQFSGGYNADVVWGDPQLFGAPGEVPTPTATPTN